MGDRKRIALVCNNYGGAVDGIGDYARVLVENLPSGYDVTVYTAQCSPQDSCWKRFSNFGMYEQINKLMKSVEVFDYIIVEYPFVEWNPLIVFVFYKLASFSKSNHIKLVVSVHEYGRVHRLRKFVIERLVAWADLVMVTNDEMVKALSPTCKKVVIREIPSNICNPYCNKPDNFKKNSFVYFGLVNKAKAFDEMLAGWDMFNCNGENVLHVCTATKLSNIEKHRNVCYHYRATADEVTDILNESVFCILPIKPFVDEKNGTFKTAVLHGCICVGRFCGEYNRLPFVVSVDNYTSADFHRAFVRCKEMTDEMVSQKVCGSANYGVNFMPNKIIARTLGRLDY